MGLALFIVCYAVGVRSELVNCGPECYEVYFTNHQVQFTDRVKAEKFIQGLKPYNIPSTLSNAVPDRKRFITGLMIRQGDRRKDD